MQQEEKITQEDNFKLDYTIYTDINDILCDIKFIKSNKKIKYANVPFVFDIEVSSFYDADKNKRCCMYAFVFGINGKCVIMRTWNDFINCINAVVKKYDLNINKRIIIYCHNLSYEFSFICKMFEWHNVFSISDRTPIYAMSIDGVEFRCSYLLSGYSLASVGKNLTKYKVQKMVGDLDYKKIRHSETPLTDKELGYILNDGLVVMAYIQECIEQEQNNITNIPLTKTGYVRRYCRHNCFYDGDHDDKQYKFKEYYKYIHNQNISSIKEYQQLKRAFQGGHTHANALYVGKVINDVMSYDISSSYPSVLIAEKYPISTGELVEVKTAEQFKDYLKYYCCVFDITFYNLKSKTNVDDILSGSKCFDEIDVIYNNGKVDSATQISTTITNVDYESLKRFYKFDAISVKNFRIYQKGYLHIDLIKSVLKLYGDKTTLKGVEEMEVEYLNSKGMLNSVYGMMVTDIVRDEIKYDVNNGWYKEKGDAKKQLDKYNNSTNRFLFYPVGVFCTAYARRNLYCAMLNVGNDFIYSDTDSVKFCNYNNHLEWFKKYNDNQYKKLEKAMQYHNLPIELIKPKTIEGKEKIIGLYEIDGVYKKFKTLGAKRYMYLDDKNTYHTTIAGLGKDCVNYMIEQNPNNPFDFFNDKMYIPREKTGKNTHTYLDFEFDGEVIDYMGKSGKYHEFSGVHMESCEFTLDMLDSFIKFLLGYELIEL